MHCSKYLAAIAFTLPFVTSYPYVPPTLCPIGKICPWGYGEVYTISEAHPNVTQESRLFQVSQKYNDHDHDHHEECSSKSSKPRRSFPLTLPRCAHCVLDGAYDRVYTIFHLQFSGLGGDGCSLVFNVPCNNTTPIIHRGSPIISARTLQFPNSPPTWNNVVDANPALVGSQSLGTFKDFDRDTFTVINPSVCSNLGNLAFIFEMAPEVKGTAELTFNQTVMNADIVTGAYVNFNC